MLDRKWYKIIEDIHLFFLLTAILPVLFYAGERIWIGLAFVGALVGMQCYDYITAQEKKENLFVFLCKMLLVTGLLYTAGSWEWGFLYYAAVNPHVRRNRFTAVILSECFVVILWMTQDAGKSLLYLLLHVGVIGVELLLLYLLDQLFLQMQQKEEQLHSQIENTALNELKVKNLNHELAVKYQLADTNARLEERENIARNIHNVVGHTITSAIVSLQAYKTLAPIEPQRADEKLTAASERMRLALEEIRRAVRVLDQDTELISINDFSRIIKTELERFSTDTEIKVSHNLDEVQSEQTMNKRCAEFLHSVVTECLNNGIRHGNATSFLVLLRYDQNHISLSAADNGTGFQALSKQEQTERREHGYGLKKIEKFVLEHGGKMKVDTEIGFEVRIEMPLF